MSSAVKLLEKHSYKEITVLDLVSDSGVNRNTFYYHFKDMPALVEELARRGVDRAFEGQSLSACEKLEKLINNFYDNRKSIMHVYGSMDRETFDKGLNNICEHLTGRMFERGIGQQTGSDEENTRLLMLSKSCLYGLMSDTLMRGLPDSDRRELIKLCTDIYMRLT